jgi:integrase/recombinase XerD
MNRPDTTLDQIIEYLQHWRALGRIFDQEERILVSLHQSLQIHQTPDLDQASFEVWCKSFDKLTGNVRRNRQRIVRNFCLYRQRTDPEYFVPDINRFARLVPHCAPVIFGETEVADMLAATKKISPTSASPLRGEVLRLAIVLLYTAGLRRGELLRLTLADVDSVEGVLRIRESKFHKSRFVPLSVDASRELRNYLKRRLAPPLSIIPDSPLLCHCVGGLRGYTGTGLSQGIHELLRSANVHDLDGREPRVHDFRHSFAIQALLRWYREGDDVQSNLPKLAMYMGHVSIVSTAWYLKWIPAIAEAASLRFESHFGHLIDGGVK